MRIPFIAGIFLIMTFASTGQRTDFICYQEEVGIFPLDKLNTKSIEFSPVFYQQGLVYVVAREKTRFLDPKTGQAYFDLMYADLGPDGETSKPVSFSPNIRTQYHEGPCTFNAGHTEMFFTRSNLSGNVGINDKKGNVQLKIYRAVKGSDDWEGITALPFCSDQYASAHPALSPDGDFLVFASDMPGGFGGMDLYLVNRKQGQWSEPLNLGAVINTKGHEVFPFWHPSGYLVFSSNGHKGKGGLDLFVSAWNADEIFSGLQHLSAPFNSSKDDLGLIISADGTSGYFASDRKPTKGKDDLYRWMSPRSVFCAPPALPLDIMITSDILVMDENAYPIERAYAWLIPMAPEGPSLYTDHFVTDLVPDEERADAFYLRWSVTDTLSAETADAVSSALGQIRLDATQGSSYILVVQRDGYQPWVNVVPGEGLPRSVTLKKKPVISETCLDTRFTLYNSTGDLVLNGAMIQLSGSCLSSPLVFYTDEMGTAVRCLPKDCTLRGEFTQEGYATHSFTFTSAEADEHWKIYLKSSEHLTSPAAPIASGTVIVIDNIYYDFNKSEIRKGDASELNALAAILKQYPDLTIELTSHTDTRGTAEYNMELSRRRSESSKSYLVLRGVAAGRIITKAAGESQPRNKCLDDVPCTEEEHQYNRRTEVRITNPAQGMEIRYKGEG